MWYLCGVRKRRVVCFAGAGVYHKNSRDRQRLGCYVIWSGVATSLSSYHSDVIGVSEYSASLRRDATDAVHRRLDSPERPSSPRLTPQPQDIPHPHPRPPRRHHPPCPRKGSLIHSPTPSCTWQSQSCTRNCATHIRKWSRRTACGSAHAD